MENQETFQEETQPVYAEVKELGEKPKKNCKTCGNKGIGKNNVQILVFGFGMLFLAFYGLVALCKDVASLFTR
jgi:hypothetical protein